MRRIATIDEIIDIMSSIRGGSFVTICYMSSAKVGKTLTSKGIDIDKFGEDLEQNRTEGDDEIYNTLSQYQKGGASRSNKFPFGGIVKMSRYQVNWQSEESYNKKYSQYADARDELLAKYGASVTHRDSHDEKQDFGKGGVSVGATDNTRGKLYTHQNGATIQNAKSEYFVVDKDGELLGSISPNAIEQIVAKSGDPDGVGALKKIGATDEQIREYTEELRKLNFKVLKLMYNSVLFIIATVNGEKIFYINDKLERQVGSGNYIVPINPQSFIQKANEIFQQSNRLQEIARYNNNYIINENMKKVIRLTESDLHRVIKESVKQVMNELDWRTYQSASDKAAQRGDSPRAEKFQRAAYNSFNRENGYGIDKIPYGDDDSHLYNSYQDKDSYYAMPNTDSFRTISQRNGNQNGSKGKLYHSQNIGSNIKNSNRGQEVEPTPHTTPDAPKGNTLNPMLKMKQMRGDKQVRDYFNGKSQYKNGKWK